MSKTQSSEGLTYWSFDHINFLNILPKKRGPKAKGTYRHHELYFIASHEVFKLEHQTSTNETHTWDFTLKLDRDNQDNPGGVIRKIVVYLHESFRYNKREFKKLPIKISESGYAPFQITVVFELCSKLMLVNDDDCYKEPSRKYEKYLQQTFLYELTFPNEGSEYHSDSAVLQVPFYTNNPKIIHEMNNYQTCRALLKFTETYELDISQHDAHSLLTSKKKPLPLIQNSRQRQPRQKLISPQIYNLEFSKPNSASFNRLSILPKYNSSRSKTLNHSRHASHPVNVHSFDKIIPQNPNYYIQDAYEYGTKRKSFPIYRNVDEKTSVTDLKPSSYCSNPPEKLEPWPQHNQSAKLISTATERNSLTDYSTISSYKTSIADQLAADSKQSMMYSNITKSTNSICKQGNCCVDYINKSQNALPGRMPLAMMTKIQPTNIQLQPSTNANNNRKSLNGFSGDMLQCSVLMPKQSPNFTYHSHSNSDCTMLYNSKNNFSNTAPSSSRLKNSYTEQVNVPPVQAPYSLVPLATSMDEAMLAKSLPPVYQQICLDGTSAIQNNLLPAQLRLLSIPSNNHVAAQHELNAIGCGSEGGLGRNLLPPPHQITTQYNVYGNNETAASIENYNIDMNPQFEHFNFDKPQIGAFPSNNDLNLLQNFIDSSYIVEQSQSVPTVSSFQFQNPPNTSNMTNIDQNYMCSGPPVNNLSDSQIGIDSLSSILTSYALQSNMACTENQQLLNNPQNNANQLAEECYSSAAPVINRAIDPSIQNCINTLLLGQDNESSSMLLKNNNFGTQMHPQNLIPPIAASNVPPANYNDQIVHLGNNFYNQIPGSQLDQLSAAMNQCNQTRYNENTPLTDVTNMYHSNIPSQPENYQFNNGFPKIP